MPDHVVALLGTMPDMQIAAKYGFSKNTIGRRRKALGIAPYKKDKT